MTAEADGATSASIVVGIGASAGGQLALTQLLDRLPADSGMAFVIVQHLSPTHESVLAELLGRHTRMRVCQVAAGMRPVADHVYVIPPDRNLALDASGFILLEQPADGRLRLPIDHFFRSLARVHQDHAIAIVLSGAGADGSQGVRAIKEHGGLVIAQEPTSAGHASMPQSAIDTGLVDFVLAPADIPERLRAYARHPYLEHHADDAAPERDAASLAKVLALVRDHSGHDFAAYKPMTIYRRIERRVAIHQLDGVAAYARYLAGNPSELQALFQELLIGVTSFFRDPEAFAALETTVIPRLFEERSDDEPIRVWVPGCASGEEAYSIAILLAEHRARLGIDAKVQLFATDLDPEAIQLARRGRYPASIAADVSPERLSKYFVHDGDSHTVVEQVRSTVMFAVHSLTQDPPFSRVDLISCRNLLIYLSPSLQKRVLTTAHYALRRGRFLFLGTADSADDVPHLFRPLDRRHRLFERTGEIGATATLGASFVTRPGAAVTDRPSPPLPERTLREIVEQALLDDVPTTIVAHPSGEIVYVHGRTGKYLEVPPGKGIASNLLRMVREPLRLPLASVLHRASTRREPVIGEVVPSDDGAAVQVSARPGPLPDTVLVRFDEVDPPAVAPVDRDARLVEQERELQRMREYVQSTVEDLATTNEELRSANEELQSANEELETSREELQSVNEELVTLNGEHEAQIEELTRVRNDLRNAFTQLDIGIIFLDRNLCIRQFNAAATRISSLRAVDVGRPLDEIVAKIDYGGMVADARAVFDDLTPREVEIRTASGQWYAMQIRPYRTVDDLIDGVTLTFYDVTARRQAEEALAAQHRALARLRAITGATGRLGVLLERAVDGAREICGADLVCVWLLEPVDGAPLATQLGLAPLDPMSRDDLVGLAADLTERRTLDEVSASSAPVAQRLSAAGVRSAQLSRLTSRGGVLLGVLCVGWVVAPRPRTAAEPLFELLEREIANLIEHRLRTPERNGAELP